MSSVRTSFIWATPSAAKKLLTLDAGHYHPTEGIADKISSVLQFLPEILLHVSRGVRWDSDHVVILNDDLLAIAREIGGERICQAASTSGWIILTPASTASRRGPSARATCSARCSSRCWNRPPAPHSGSRGRFHHAAGVAGGGQDAAVRRGLGLLLRKPGRARRRGVAGGSQDVTKKKCLSKRANKLTTTNPTHKL